MHAACNASCRHADACKETHATEVAGKQKQKQMEMKMETHATEVAGKETQAAKVAGKQKEKQTTKVRVVELQRGR